MRISKLYEHCIAREPIDIPICRAIGGYACIDARSTDVANVLVLPAWMCSECMNICFAGVANVSIY